MANDPGVMTAGSPKISDDANNKVELVDNNTQGTCDTMESVSDRLGAKSADKAQGPVNEIQVSGVDGISVVVTASHS